MNVRRNILQHRVYRLVYFYHGHAWLIYDLNGSLAGNPFDRRSAITMT